MRPATSVWQRRDSAVARIASDLSDRLLAVSVGRSLSIHVALRRPVHFLERFDRALSSIEEKRSKEPLGSKTNPIAVSKLSPKHGPCN